MEAGESRQVTLKLPRRALQYYDVISKSFGRMNRESLRFKSAHHREI
ncbi:hypothetical protein NXV57_04820 [Bacteroides thetaiotaomicron]|nr:hypothetical protein [Bacteroides thetaiotaomicron]